VPLFIRGEVIIARQGIITILCGFVILSACFSGERSLELAVGPMVTRELGYTDYRLEATVEDQMYPGVIGDIRSELEFPLDVTLAGVSLRLDFHTASGKTWGIGVGFITNVDYPSSPLIDQDWMAFPGGFDGQFAYFESDVDLHMYLLTSEGYFRVIGANWVSVSLLGHFTYQEIGQTAMGYDGWTTNLVTMGRLQVRGSERAIDYEVTYLSPQLGGKIVVDFGHGVELDMKASAGFVFCSDEDDHLLRGKLSTADAIGFGCSAETTLFLLPWFAPRRDFAIGIVGSFRYYQAEGNQTQRWYRDEGEITAGTEIENIPHEFESYQYSVGLQIVGIADSFLRAN
jgi:hypothetical protein